jgi:AcrR family transcriptional regulator
MGVTERREKEKLMKKNEIIDAAEKVLFEKGFEQTKMEDIAKEAEYTKKTIYSYFSSKDEIYIEIMLRGFKVLNELYDNILSSSEEKSELEKMKLLGQGFVQFSLKFPGYFKVIMDYENKEIDFDANNENELLKKCYKEGQYSIELLNQCINNAIRKGEISSQNDPVTLSHILWSFVLGLSGLTNKKEKYLSAFYNKNTSEIFDEGFKFIINAIKI